ncbi:MAG: hypothetical protein HOD76_00700 [Cryomorphaceae bacterium]|nr:hypothetical protein [Cryomorphaceae bacterium]MDC6466107.1 hypothetical protein [Flavobacteriaceae bacterium]MBT3684787.1 hypothetical protein [Cryomorphaceae bacterium]MBT4236706.1 hypothetical protein [Cryomorphaceae bacterium]MBT4813822.1 hypothetical protein [Cryomorphaceae bacterium]
MFNLKKNRRFNYTPRFFRGKEDISINFESKISKSRDQYNSIDMGMNWSDQRHKKRNTGNRGVNLTLILTVIFLILVFLYIIDFDLTIFYTN